MASGDTVVLRVEQPSAVPRDLALSPDDNTAALRVTVTEVLSDERFGAFALDASPTPAANAMVNLAWLQEQLELEGTANLMLLGLEGSQPDGMGRAMERATARLAARRRPPRPGCAAPSTGRTPPSSRARPPRRCARRWRATR